MSQVSVKFNIGDVFFTFDSESGTISRHVASAIQIESPISGSIITIAYISNNNRQKFYEDEAYTESEIRELANTWILDKSISIFSSAGL